MFKRAILVLSLSTVLGAAMPGVAWPMSSKEAISEALKSNPEVLGAAGNREAVEFELREARGLYLPTLDLEASTGGRLLDTPARRRLGADDDAVYSADAGLAFRQTLFDGGSRRTELDRQAARIDGASFRVHTVVQDADRPGQ